MTTRKPYYPSKTFDEDLGAFVDMCTVNKWEFPGIPLKSLQDAIAAQRAERASHDALELQYRKQHESFGVAQAQRYALFACALHAARGLFRNNRAVLAQLARFTGNKGNRRKKAVVGGDAAAGSLPVPSRPPVTP